MLDSTFSLLGLLTMISSGTQFSAYAEEKVNPIQPQLATSALEVGQDLLRKAGAGEK